MKLTKQQLDKIKKFAKPYYAKNDPWHNLEHIEFTVKLAEYLAKKENADVNKCIVAAYLHDIKKLVEKEGKDHGTEAAIISKPFLKSIGISDKDTDDICYAIDHHNKGGLKKTKESKIMQDADHLQILGPYGFARHILYWTSKGMDQEQAYKKYIEEQAFFLPRFKTKTAKSILKDYSKFMNEFHRRYKEIEKVKFK